MYKNSYRKLIFWTSKITNFRNIHGIISERAYKNMCLTNFLKCLNIYIGMHAVTPVNCCP